METKNIPWWTIRVTLVTLVTALVTLRQYTLLSEKQPTNILIETETESYQNDTIHT